MSAKNHVNVNCSLFQKARPPLLLYISAFLFSAIFTFFSGIHWGWVDDVFYANNLSALYSPLPIYDPDFFIGLAPLLIKLYASFPTIGWLGIFLMSLLIIVYIMTIRLVNQELLPINISNYIIILIGFIIAAIFQQFVVRLNFTSVSCLACGVGLLSVFHGKRRAVIFSGILLLLLGMLIRWQTSIPIISIVLIYTLSKCVIYDKVRSGYKKMHFTSCSAVVIVILSVIFFRIVFPNLDAINFNRPQKLYELFIQDGYMIPGNKLLNSDSNRLIYEAILSWNTQDEKIINDDFFKNIIVHNDVLSFRKVNEIIIRKLNLAYKFSNRYGMNAECMNWFVKSTLFILLILSTFLISLTIKRHRMLKISVLIIILFGGLQTLLLAIFFKIEDRFFSPYLFIMLLCILLSLQLLQNKLHRVCRYFAISLFFSSSVYMLYNAIQQAEYLKKDIRVKSQIIYEINNFSDKIILFDAFVPYMLQVSPFKTVQLNKSNQYIIGLHYARVHFHSLKNAFSPICPDNTYRGVLECIQLHKEKVVWAYWDFNIDFTQRWNERFYNDTLHFNEINSGSVLSKNSNTYLWDKHKYGYYILE